MPPNTQVGESSDYSRNRRDDMAYNRENVIAIPEGLDPESLSTMDDVEKYFTEKEVVEIVKRYLNIRWMQQKSRKVQAEKMRRLKEWGKELS